MANPDPPSDSASRLPQEKLALEVDKLRVEIHNLKRPNFALWITALLGILGTGIQYVRSNQDLQAASIKKDKAELDLARLTVAKDSLTLQIQQNHLIKASLDSIILATQLALDSLRVRRDQVEVHLASLRTALANAKTQIATAGATSRPANAAAQRALTQASEVLDKLGASVQQTAAYTSQTRDTLQAIRTELRGDSMRVQLRLSDVVQLWWHRVQTPSLVTALPGTFSPGDTFFTIPYGGTIFVQARNPTTGAGPTKRVDCTRATACFVAFP
jgi:hypothetical protein